MIVDHLKLFFCNHHKLVFRICCIGLCCLNFNKDGIKFFLMRVDYSGPLRYDHLKSVFQSHNLLIFDNIVRWRHHMKLMLQIRLPLSISS